MTELYSFDNCPNRQHTDSVKYDRYVDSDILPMWVADMDFAVAPEINAAICERSEHPVYGYTHAPAELVDLIVDRMQKRYDWDIKPEWLMWLPGVVTGVNVACRAFGDTHSQVLCPAVIYPYIPEAARLNHRQLVNVPMQLNNQRWVMDGDWLQQRDEKSDSLLLLCNPHNPGGTVYSETELRQLAEMAVSRDLIVVSDEVHCDLILEPGLRHIPIASLGREIEKRSITLMAASKTFNLAGLSCSFAIIPDQSIRRQFHRASEGIVSYVNLFGYLGTYAAYQFGEGWRLQLIDYLRGNRDFLMDEINQIRGLELNPIEATYLAWIDVSKLEIENPHRFFESAGVGMSPGREFGDNQFMRLNFGCSRATLAEAVSRIRHSINQHWDSNHV